MSNTMLCRLCVKEVEEFVYLFNLCYEDTEVYVFISDLLHITMEQDFTMLVICSACNNILSNFHQFYKMVKEAQKNYEEVAKRFAETALQSPFHLKEEIFEIEYTDNDTFNFNEEDVKKEDIDKCSMEKSVARSKKRKKSKKQQQYLTNDNEFCEQDDIILKDLIKQEVPSTIVEKKKKTKKVKGIKTEKKIKPVSKTKQTLRSEDATKTLLSRYRIDELCQNGKWVLNEEQIDGILPLYVDMTCNKCPHLSFNTYRDLDEHTSRHHGAHPRLHCCRCYTSERLVLESHILYEHILQKREAKIPCPMCGKLIRRMVMKEHLSSHLPHNQREFQCEHCHAGFGIKGRLTAHIKAFHSPSSVTCDECGKLFRNKFIMRHHKKKVHCSEDDLYLCPDCGKKFKTVISFQNHLNAHKGISNRVKCHLCNAVVKQISLSRHMRDHDPKKLKQCPQCPQKVPNVREHVLNVHEKIKPFACSFCPMMFRRETPLQDHIASRHTGIPRYSCEFCDKKFMSSGNYHLHRKRMHPVQVAEMKLSAALKKDSEDIPVATTLKKRLYIDDLKNGPAVRPTTQYNPTL